MIKLTQREKDLGYCETAQTYCSMAEEMYQQGKADGAREFAEWLQENVFVDVENGVTVVAELEYTRVISFIELLEMYEKEQKND